MVSGSVGHRSCCLSSGGGPFLLRSPRPFYWRRWSIRCQPHGSPFLEFGCPSTLPPRIKTQCLNQADPLPMPPGVSPEPPRWRQSLCGPFTPADLRVEIRGDRRAPVASIETSHPLSDVTNRRTAVLSSSWRRRKAPTGVFSLEAVPERSSSVSNDAGSVSRSQADCKISDASK